MSSLLEGRRAIVTGAGNGIGRETAKVCAREGARVGVLDVDADAAGRTVAEIGKAAIPLVADLTDEGQVEAAVERAVAAWGGLDTVVGCAGVQLAGRDDRADRLSLDVWRRTLDVNLTGTFNCIRAAVPHMLGAGGGRIVNVASVAGILMFKNRAPYNVSKAGIVALTKSVALELAGEGITCNAVAPGVIETPLTRDYFSDPELAPKIKENTPLGRWGQPEDLVGPVVFLCGPGAEFVQGETLVVDGGWVAGKGY
jgi:NAD(P)-dependent dehydrogenase (short-subunit alcohol dehydrogenase family)